MHIAEIPEYATAMDAARFLEVKSKLPLSLASPDFLTNGICWCAELKKFLAVFGVKNERNLVAAYEYERGNLHDSYMDRPLHSKAIVKATLTFSGSFPALYKTFNRPSELAAWLTSANRDELDRIVARMRKESTTRLPSITDVLLGTVVTLGSLGLGYKTMFANSPREDSKATAQSLLKAISLRSESN